MNKPSFSPDAIDAGINEYLDRCTHVIIKLGTNILTPFIETGDEAYFLKLASSIKKIQQMNKKPLIVSSGAVGFGKKIRFRRDALNGNSFIPKKQYSIVEKQAFASLGQSFLIDTYRNTFDKTGMDVAQVLVTTADLQSRTHYQNLKRTLDQLMEWQSIPVINENDVVAQQGLKFGDNDTLSALIAGLFPQSLLIILTTIDGFYMNDRKIDVVTDIGREEMAAAGDPLEGGIGGMKTKLLAGRKISRSGQVMNIAPGVDPSIIDQIVAGNKVGTWFLSPVQEASESELGSSENKDNKTHFKSLSGKRRWMLHHRHVMGRVVVDSGAENALRKEGASLLAVGVVSVQGGFSRGDIIDIANEEGRVFGRGISSKDSKWYLETVSRKGEESIHRDNLVLLEDI